jgi:putative heme degradation protein
MSEDNNPGQPAPREILQGDFAAILQRVPAFGKVMVITRLNGATHERIGPAKSVTSEGGRLRVTGEAHSAVIDAGHLASAVADRSVVMGGTVLPRVEFRDGRDEAVFSVIALDGLAPFDVALGPLGRGQPEAEKEKPPREQSSVADDDAGAQLLDKAKAGGALVTIRVERPGFEQAWTGIVAEVKPGGGFINIMTADFHLHLRGGAVARWDREADGGTAVLHAVGPSGKRSGLTVSGPATVFGE